MSDRLEQALDRVGGVASKAESEGRGMEISEIVEAVVGLDSDEELESLASIAMESSDGGLSLEDMANGVMKLLDWRKQNT